jgi:WD40 repeat protein
LAFRPDGQRFATASDDRTVKLWDPETGQEVFTLRGHTRCVLCVAFSPDGQRLVTGSIDRTAKVWDIGPPSAEVLRRREAVARVQPLFDKLLDKNQVLKTLRADVTLREPTRTLTLEIVQCL